MEQAPSGVLAGHPRRWSILAVLVICLLVVVLDNTILNVALKSIQSELDATQSEMEWAINSYTLVFAGLMFTAGVLGDRFGRRRFLVIGLIIFGAASALSAFSDSPMQLIVTRALMGIGAAMVQPQTLSIITNVFGPKERGKAIGIWAGFSGVAIALGPITGGFLLEHYWWGSVFLVNVPVVIVGVVAAALVIPESADPHPKRLDPIGAVLSIVGISALVYGIIRGGETADWARLDVWGPIVGGLAVVALFVWLEWRSSHPSLDVSLFRKPAFSAATFSISVVFFAMMGLTFAAAYYLQAVRDYSPLVAGALIVPVSLGIALTAPQSARMVARFGTRAVVTSGMLLAGASMGAYYFQDLSTPIWMFEVNLFLMGLGMGSVMAPATESIMSTVPREKAGAGSAINNTVRMVSGALGVAILGSLLSATYRSHLGDAVNTLPAESRHDAGESIGGTLQAIGDVARGIAAGQLPPSAGSGLRQLAEQADQAFLSGMHAVALWAFVISWIGALVSAIYLPRKPRKTVETSTETAELAEANQR